MSSKVEQADRSLLRSRAHEPTGEVESLRGRNDVGRMGDRMVGGGGQKHTRPSELLRDQEKKRKKTKKQQQPEDYNARRSDHFDVASRGQSILDLDKFRGYQPTTQSARAAYETILTMIGLKAHLGNQDPNILRDAAEEVIQILKDGGLRDPERHDQLSRLLTGKGAFSSSRSAVNGGMASEKYAEFTRLGKRLDDFDDISRQDGGGGRDRNNNNGTSDRVDDEMGVAVVFHDSDDENEDPNDPEGASDIEDGVVIDASSDSEVEDDEDESKEGHVKILESRGHIKGGNDDDDDNGDDEEKLIQGRDTKTQKKKDGTKNVY